jgi:hypothetical protein
MKSLSEIWKERIKDNNINVKGKISVLEVIKKHLEESILFTNGEYRPKGGLFIDPKPKNIRVDVVMLNLLAATYFKDDKIVRGLVNINIQHEDRDRIDVLEAVILDVMDNAYVDGYLFNITNEPIMMRLSRTLFMTNIRAPFDLEKGKYKLEKH